MATLVFDIETSALPLELFDEAQQKPITVFASSGDSGASSRR